MSQGLLPCPACARHVRASEPACPFCAAELPARAAPAPIRLPARLSRAALFALGVALATTAEGCADSDPSGDGGDMVDAGDGGWAVPLYGAAPHDGH